jgi:hypothetical protein
MATRKRCAVNTDRKAALPERIIQKLKQHARVNLRIR